MPNPSEPHYKWAARPNANVDKELLLSLTRKVSVEFGDFHPLLKKDIQSRRNSEIPKNGISENDNLSDDKKISNILTNSVVSAEITFHMVNTFQGSRKLAG